LVRIAQGQHLELGAGPTELEQSFREDVARLMKMAAAAEIGVPEEIDIPIETTNRPTSGLA
jgi:hypothetical protein